MSRCVILSAGPVEDSERLRPLLKTDDWIIGHPHRLQGHPAW